MIIPFGYFETDIKNLFIGGIGATVSTPTILATKFSFIESEISNFNVDGDNNISCHISNLSYGFVANIFLNNISITYIVETDGRLTDTNQSIVQNATNLTTFYANGITNTNYSSPFRNCRITFVDLPNITNNTLGSHTLRDNPNLVYARFSELITVVGAGASFHDGTGLERVYIPKVVTWNTFTTTLQTFYLIKTGCTIYVKPSELTVDGGNPAHPIAYAETSRSAILVGVVNFTSPSAVTNLSDSNITATTVDLDFTAPSTTNALDFYEVWIERQDLGMWETDRVKERYRIHQEITTTGDTVSGLITSTNYKITIYACDIYWNRSAVSNEIQITTS